ncbi:hypothetical protein E2C01_032595 [Portunus trituberculatus]|uniref:Uncharacterized protein n=1 Tax=Portunus trituberculatus TaxID=210409 RepID=A0A5B7F014_PORTR|nr:hypothetical protein [Portunus trituberculatus]
MEGSTNSNGTESLLSSVADVMERQFFLRKTGEAGGSGTSEWVEVSGRQQDEQLNYDVLGSQL